MILAWMLHFVMAMKRILLDLSLVSSLVFQLSNAFAACSSPPIPALKFYQHFTRYFHETAHDREMRKLLDAIELSDACDPIPGYDRTYFQNPKTAYQLNQSKRFRSAFDRRLKRTKDCSVLNPVSEQLDLLFAMGNANKGKLHSELKRAIRARILMEYGIPEFFKDTSEKFLKLDHTLHEKSEFFRELLILMQDDPRWDSRVMDQAELPSRTKHKRDPFWYEMKQSPVKTESQMAVQTLYRDHVRYEEDKDLQKKILSCQNELLAQSMLRRPMRFFLLLDTSRTAQMHANAIFTCAHEAIETGRVEVGRYRLRPTPQTIIEAARSHFLR